MEDRPWLKYYDTGVPKHIDYPEVPLFYFLEEDARKYPDTPCTIFKGAKISYREMNEITDRLAAGLADIGVKKGDRVGICHGLFCHSQAGRCGCGNQPTLQPA